jgi:hypothetical protein
MSTFNNNQTVRWTSFPHSRGATTDHSDHLSTSKCNEIDSPTSVTQTIANKEKVKSTEKTVLYQTKQSSPILKSRERVQSFLRKTLYNQSEDTINAGTSVDRQSLPRQSHSQLTVSLSPNATQTIFFDGISANEENCIVDKQISLNSISSPGAYSSVRSRDDDIVESSSIGSATSTSSYLSVGSAGCIGISRPSYESSFDTFVNFTPPLRTVGTSPKLPVTQKPSDSTVESVKNTVSPKKRSTLLLKVDTSFGLAAVNEEGEADEEIVEDEHYLAKYRSRFGLLLKDSDEEVDIVFEEKDDLVSTPLLGCKSGSDDLFDRPFDSEVNEAAIYFSLPSTLAAPRNQSPANKDSQNIGSGPSSRQSVSMKSLSRYLAKNSASEFVIPADDNSRCNSTQSVKRSMSQSLRSLGGDVKRKSKELKHRVQTSSPVSTRLTGSNFGDADATNFKIFLLLLDPKTKIFELIQLLFPAGTTTVGDILRMIPRNATEKKLGGQSYVGLTRPRRSSEPMTNLDQIAHFSLSKRSTDSETCGGLRNGDVAIAIPEECELNALKSLGKQILANPHIQKLVGFDNRAMKRTKKKAREMQKENGLRSTIVDSPKHSNRNMSRPDEEMDMEGKERVVSGHMKRSPRKVVLENETTIMKSVEVFHRNASLPTFEDSLSSDHYEKELQRAIDKVMQSNSDSDFSPVNSPPSYEERKINVETCKSLASMNTLFPTVDALDAFLAAREERSSSITSRGSRTTIEDCSTKEDTYDSDTGDDSSLTGSFESSFNSWSRSLDNSRASRYSGSVRSMDTKTPTIITFDESSITVKEKTTSKFILQRLGKTIFRGAIGTSVFMLLRYCLDAEGGYTSTVAVLKRAEVPLKPLGLIGFIYFLVIYVCLVKIQLLFEKKKRKHHFRHNEFSRCPILQAGFDLCELLTANNGQVQ